jgi:hypothetical protein
MKATTVKTTRVMHSAKSSAALARHLRKSDQILHARDRLNLSPDDEFGDLLDERALQKKHGVAGSPKRRAS